jgi:hypothetical protein
MKITKADEQSSRGSNSSETGCESSSHIDVAAEVARRQQVRLHRGNGRIAASSPTSSPAKAPRPGRWVHVPLAELFAEQGNHLHAKWGGLLETGHEPVHGSKSSRCVLINPERGSWLCRSCGERGDAATLVMALAGIGHREAATHLTRRYGPPGNGTSRQPNRPSTTWLEA